MAKQGFTQGGKVGPQRPDKREVKKRNGVVVGSAKAPIRQRVEEQLTVQEAARRLGKALSPRKLEMANFKNGARACDRCVTADPKSAGRSHWVGIGNRGRWVGKCPACHGSGTKH